MTSSGSLFDPAALRMLAAEHGPSDAECAQKLALVQRLIARQSDGTLAALCETRVEQSFNERLFADLFDYRTLFRDGQADYHLQPKGRHAVSRRFDDFGLGFFGPDGGDVVVLCELKDPGCHLDAPQTSGSYKGQSPVAQAHRAASGSPSVRWLLISNFDEIRLYRAGHPAAFEPVLLSDILSLSSFRRAHALLARATLLGDGRSLPPLERLYTGGSPMVLPAKANRIRLVQTAVPTAVRSEPLALPEMYDVLEKAIKGLPALPRTMWLRVPPRLQIDVDGDRLVTRFGHPTDRLRIEFTNAGAVHVSEYVNDDGNPVLNALDLVTRHAAFLLLCSKSAARMLKVPFNVSCELLDLNKTLCDDEGMGRGLANSLVAPAGLVATQAPARRRELEQIGQDGLVDGAMATTRELLFAFRASNPIDGETARFRPTQERVSEVIARMLA